MRSLASIFAVTLTVFAVLASVDGAEAKSCTELRSLCWTMRAAKSDCAGPYQRCRKTGVFTTPLGRRFQATSRD